MDIAYRPRQKSDDPFIIQLTLQTMRSVYLQSTGTPVTEAMVKQQIEENATTIIIETRNRPIGYYSYTVLPSGQLYWSALILSPQFQNKGIGSKVQKRIEREAGEGGVQSILVHVQMANSQALMFCLKNGYRILGPHMKGMLALEKRLSNKLDNH